MNLFQKEEYNLTYFLTIIAQEELSKIIILPIAKELGELEKIVTDKKNLYYNHSLKQKVFTSFGLQNRSHRDIEALKQSCLYVGIKEGSKPHFVSISKDQAYEEIIRTLKLAAYLIVQIYTEKSLSLALKKSVVNAYDSARNLSIKEIPGIMVDLMIDVNRHYIKPNLENREVYLSEVLFSNPYTLINILKKTFGKADYLKHLKIIQKFSIMELSMYTAKALAEGKDVAYEKEDETLESKGLRKKLKYALDKFEKSLQKRPTANNEN